jgi:Holliday junction resolvase
MGRSEREKGARAEREVASLLTKAGFDGRRTAALQANAGRGADVSGLPGVHLEVKFQEKLGLWAAIRQAEDGAEDGEVPAVVFRKSREPWRVVVPLDYFLFLHAEREL